ncbi:terminase large subunit domain-containing protein [Cupriavidus nantongensis]|uniref:Terminase n=1 Tax=Cupriavidus nantongensis TaxID=1796606 RepID=A0A142JHV8_9BURK|nr:terminase family protein [Cupriavidus nantongensis]AMR77670.1 terminase [Cupriavidus nantongensis]
MPSLNVPQAQFLALPHKFKAFVAGFGSGKTWVGGAGLCKHAWEFPRINAGYFAPTYGQIRDIFFPTIEEVAHDWGLVAKVNASNKEVHLYSGRRYRTTIICRSMDDPGKIVGFKIGKALVDELDVMRKIEAQTAWRKIIARMRQVAPGLLNGIDVTTTPEGFKFVYEQFVKAAREKPELASLYGLVQASTYQNAKNLPDDYIDSLRASYPPQLIAAYLRGMFVNLTSGSVYPNFDRRLNHTDEVMEPGEPLHVGMDFNVLKMAAVILVVRKGEPRAVGELTEVRDTPAMAKLLKERFKDKGHHIKVYPDASGQNTSSKNASESDLSILRAAGFQIEVNPTNPAVKDRLNSVNALILNDQGERRFKVNTHLCPVYTEALEQQPYDKNGEPDKSGGHDHVNDAGGYPLVKLWPIVKRTAKVTLLRA